MSVEAAAEKQAKLRRMDHVGVFVADLDAAVAFFADLGLERQGGGQVEGSWVDRIIGLDGALVDLVMMQTPDGHGQLELVKFRSPASPEADRQAPPSVPGLRHLAFVVEDIDATISRLQRHGAELVGEVVRYENVVRLCYIRSPEGIIIELAEPID